MCLLHVVNRSTGLQGQKLNNNQCRLSGKLNTGGHSWNMWGHMSVSEGAKWVFSKDEREVLTPPKSGDFCVEKGSKIVYKTKRNMSTKYMD